MSKDTLIASMEASGITREEAQTIILLGDVAAAAAVQALCAVITTGAESDFVRSQAFTLAKIMIDGAIAGRFDEVVHPLTQASGKENHDRTH
ncbi:MAG: hypothetical protein LBV29_01175 [Azoarcus sp.]|nr:hypothetical protein [Azoarcus sp.]